VLHHLTLWVPDLDRAAPSWRWLLERLGYQLDASIGHLLLVRHPDGFALVLEQSDDMVPGMLHSRFRPGLNHIAFDLPSAAALAGIVAEAGDHGWTRCPSTATQSPAAPMRGLPRGPRRLRGELVAASR
jgi:catechol 2,3-dioxygenase-like lactoylglutathione lyase family enzyme